MWEFLVQRYGLPMSQPARKRAFWGIALSTFLLGTFLALGVIGAHVPVANLLVGVALLYVLAFMMSAVYGYLVLLIIYRAILPLYRAWPAIRAFIVGFPTRLRELCQSVGRVLADLPGAVRRIGWREFMFVVVMGNLGLLGWAWWPVAKIIAAHMTWFSSSTWITAIYLDLLMSAFSLIPIMLVLRLVVVLIQYWQNR
jgi:hypothetical protein